MPGVTRSLRGFAGEQAVAVFGGAQLGPQLAEEGAALDQAHVHQVQFGRRDAARIHALGDAGFDLFLAGDGGLQAGQGLAQAHHVGIGFGDLEGDLFEDAVQVGVGGVPVKPAARRRLVSAAPLNTFQRRLASLRRTLRSTGRPWVSSRASELR
jgi:hypothetical protein